MNSDTLLLRQINPSFIQAGRVTSQAFRPTPKDQRKLSVYDGDMISPSDSWKHYTENLGFGSVGVMAVSVLECTKLDLPVQPDPKPFPEHVLINFSNLSKNQVECKAKQLRKLADERGWLFQADNFSSS